jgi:predicted ATP-dependent endonuclease of OLD family
MSVYLIERLVIKNLWGYRDLRIDFNRDVNILIGPNASGKTTILNVLRYVFTADFLGLSELVFQEVVIHLRSFDLKSRRTVKVEVTEGGYKFTISRRSFQVDLEVLQQWDRRYSRIYDITRRGIYPRRLFIENRTDDLIMGLKGLVPSVWLPVNRRLPISDESVEKTEAYSRLESVDHRLRELTEELRKYRFRLEAQLSDRYKSFEKRVLGIILYSQEHDQISSLHLNEPPVEEEDKELLLSAFQEAGLLDTQMRERIEKHFAVAQEVWGRLRGPESKMESDDLFILPLIPRTRSMVQEARELKDYRERLFASVHDYENIASEFLEGKDIRIQDDGTLQVTLTEKSAPELTLERLSSGEKQILILLTQALLWGEKPVVYVADEPELSLHVTWQERLLKSLQVLGGQIQIIVATHSPDIVGSFHDKVIDLGRI